MGVGQSRTKQALAKLHDFSNNLRQRAADRIQPRTPGAGRQRRQAPVGYATRYPTGGAGTRQPYAQNYGAMTRNPSRKAGYLAAGLKWGALATMPIALTFLGMSSMPSMGGGMGGIMYPFLAYGAMNSFMMGAASGMAMHRRRAMQAQWLGAMQAQQQGMLSPSQANPYPMQPGMPQQPQAYPRQVDMYAQPNAYRQQPGMYAQPNQYRQPPSVPQQANPYRQPPRASQWAPSPAPSDVRAGSPAAQPMSGDSPRRTSVAEKLRALPTEQRNSRFDILMTRYRNIQPPRSESESDLRPPSLLGLAQLIPAMYGTGNERATYSADNDPALRAYRQLHVERDNLPQRSPVIDQALSEAFASLTPDAQLRFKQDNNGTGASIDASRS